jgi:hypothetical protein
MYLGKLSQEILHSFPQNLSWRKWVGDATSLLNRVRQQVFHQRRVLYSWPMLAALCVSFVFLLVRRADTRTVSLPPMMAEALRTNGLVGYPVLQRHAPVPIDASAAIHLFQSTNRPSPNSTTLSSVVGVDAANTRRRGTQTIRQENSYAVADYAPHQVRFASNLDTPWATDLLMIDGQELRGDIAGLFYIDDSSGQSVKIADLKESTGELVSTNQVIYRDAFGGIKADVLYTYGEHSLEQDVVIRKQLASPDKFNLNPVTTRLAVITEFLNPPEPVIRSKPVDLSPYNNSAGITDGASLEDELIIFKTMRMARGKAFSLGNRENEVPVGKKWIKIGGRHYLSESTPYPLLKKQLDALPPDSAKVTPHPKASSFESMMAQMPAHLPGKSSANAFKVAQIRASEPGVVLDYLISGAPLLNINFGGGSINKVGFAAVGQTTNDFWNWFDFPGHSSASMSHLVWSDESSSHTGVTVSNAPGYYGNPVSDPMYGTYIYSWNGYNITVTLTNVPTGVYDFYLYGHGDANNQNGIFQLTSGTNIYGTQATTTVGSNSWTSTNWQEGSQYVVFRTVAVVSNQPVTLTVEEEAGGVGYAIINGMQLAPDNEEGAISSLISVNFGADSSAKTGPAAVGLTTNDFWNGLSYGGDQSPYGQANLLWSDGTNSNAGITVSNAPGVWGDPVTDGMYHLYVYPWDGNNIGLFVTNLPYGKYDFYLYGHGNDDNQNSIFDLSTGGTDYGTKSTATTTPAWQSTDWQEGVQYVVFRDVWVTNNQSVNIIVTPDSEGYAIVNGLQIAMAVPPLIVTQPQSQTVTVGNDAIFNVFASGDDAFQWLFNGYELPGATQPMLWLTNVQTNQTGNYSVLVTNALGSVTSSNALLTVVLPQYALDPTNLVSWWQGENNALDALGVNPGTLQGGVTFVTGKVGQAFSFDGSTGYVDVPASTSLNVGSGSGFTIEAWVRPTSIYYAQPLFEWSTGGDTEVYLWLSGSSAGSLDANIVDPYYDNNYISSASAALDTNDFQHVALTYDESSGIACLYVDGVQVQQASLGTGLVPLTTGDLYFGFDGCCNWFGGEMDEVTLYGRALAPSNIAGIYNAGYLGKAPIAPSIVTQPQNQTVSTVISMPFSVTATGTQPMSYEWFFNGSTTPIAGATNSTYTPSALDLAQLTNAVTYSALVSNVAGQATSSNATLTATCVSAPSGLVSFWPAATNAHDVVGTNNGTTVPGVIYEAGKVGNAFAFYGPNEFVEVPDSPSLDLTNGLTLEGWVFALDFYDSTYVVIAEKGDDQSSCQYMICATNVNNNWYFQAVLGLAGGSIVRCYGATPMRAQTWYHVAMTYDGSALKLYVNGVLDGSVAAGGPINTTTNSLLMGGSSFWWLYRDLVGLLDEFSIYNRALSATEIEGIFAASYKGKCNTPADPPVSETLTYLGIALSSTNVEPGQTIFYTNSWSGGPLDQNSGMVFALASNTNDTKTWLSGFNFWEPMTLWRGTTVIPGSLTIPADVPPGHYTLVLESGIPLSGAVQMTGCWGANDYNVAQLNVTNGVSAGISSPVSFASLSLSGDTVITASALNSDPTLAITNLSFFVNGTYIGAVDQASGSVNWLPPSNGNYTITVCATDILGSSATASVPVGAGAAPEIVLTSPNDQQNFIYTNSENTNILLAAANVGSTGFTGVDFYANGVFLAHATLSGSSYYYFNWTNAYSGNYVLTAVALGASGPIQTSAPVQIAATYLTVNQLTPPHLVGFPGQTLTNALNFLGGPVFGSWGPGTWVMNADGSHSGVAINLIDATVSDGWSNYTTINQTMSIPADATNGTYPIWELLSWSCPRLSMMPGTNASLISSGYGQGNVYLIGTLTITNGSGGAVPQVAITNPTNYQAVLPPPNVAITAGASEPGGTITNVEFYINGVLVGNTSTGEGSGDSFSFTWTNYTAGRYSLRAVAYDAHGVSTTSEAIEVNEDQLTVLPVQPAFVFGELGQQVQLAYCWTGGPTTNNLVPTAYLADSDGSYFWPGNAFSSFPSTTQWTNGAIITNSITIPTTAMPGSYPIYLYMTNSSTGTTRYAMNAGRGVLSLTDAGLGPRYQVGTLIVVSNGVGVSLRASPNVGSMPVGTSLNLRAVATDPYAPVTKIDFYANSVGIGEIDQDNGTISWTPTVANNYSLTAVATDVLGSTGTAQITVNVTNAPLIAITNPINNQVFSSNPVINLSCAPSEAGGSIAKVDYYANGAFVGESTTGPAYGVAWSNTQTCAEVVLQAVATDGVGATNISPAVNIYYQYPVSPAETTNAINSSVTFTIAPLQGATSYQWQFNGTNISGATGTAYTIASIAPTNAGNYAVTAATSCGTIVSLPGVLTVLGAPIIIVQPVGTNCDPGMNATLSVTAIGAAPLSYQWYSGKTYPWGSNIISGATSASITTNVSYATPALYTCVVSNAYGQVASTGGFVNRNVYLALGTGQAGSGTLASPYECSNPSNYSAIVATNQPYCSFYYLSNGTYQSFGGGYRLTTYDINGQPYTQATVWEGCKHYGRGTNNTKVQLVSHLCGSVYPHILFGNDNYQWTPWFELHDMTLDENAMNQVDWTNQAAWTNTTVFDVVIADGRDMLFTNLLVVGFGTKAGECFPFFMDILGSGDVENVKITDCTFTAPATGNLDGLTTVGLGTEWPAYSTNRSTLIITNCVFRDLRSDFRYSHAFGCPTVVNCLVTNCQVGWYGEPGGTGYNDPRSIAGPVLLSGNYFVNVEGVVNIDNHDGNWQTGPITMISNTIVLNSDTNVNYAFGTYRDYLTYPTIAAVTASCNTIRLADGLPNPASIDIGFDFANITTLVASNNVVSLGNGYDIVVEKYLIGQATLTNNTDGQGNQLLIMGSDGLFYSQQSPPP